MEHIVLNSRVEGKIPGVGVFRDTTRNDHSCNGKAAEDRTDFSVVVVRDGGQQSTLTLALSFLPHSIKWPSEREMERDI